jgi:transposase
MVIIGMDRHKRSATIEVMTADEAVVGRGRYGTDAAGLAAILAGVRRTGDGSRLPATGG